jgi:Alkylmercury lyase
MARYVSPPQGVFMPPETTPNLEQLTREVRLYVFRQAAGTAKVPQAPEIAAALKRPVEEIHDSLRHLAEGKVVILAPHDGHIWAANPFCTVPSGFHVEAEGKVYWGICIWDALGIPAALGKDAVVRAFCGDCSEPMNLEIRGGKLAQSEGLLHFAIPAHHWWDNIGFT